MAKNKTLLDGRMAVSPVILNRGHIHKGQGIDLFVYTKAEGIFLVQDLWTDFN